MPDLVWILSLMMITSIPPTFSQNKTLDSDVSTSLLPQKNVYFISGLGADQRVFDKLELDPEIKVRHIAWIKPIENESIASYAKRLSSQIDTTKAFSLVGLSFGGIVATEISDILHPEKVIIISSTPTGLPVDPFYRGLIKFLLWSPFAAPILKSPNSLAYKYFGAVTPELQILLKNILKDTDGKFLKWALKRMTAWKHPVKTPAPAHIHGDADRLIPIKRVKPDFIIKNGGHLMVYAQHEEISTILNQILR